MSNNQLPVIFTPISSGPMSLTELKQFCGNDRDLINRTVIAMLENHWQLDVDIWCDNPIETVKFIPSNDH